MIRPRYVPEECLWRKLILKLWNPEKRRGCIWPARSWTLTASVAAIISNGLGPQELWPEKAQPVTAFKKERRNFRADFAAGKTAGFSYQGRSGEKNSKDPENFFPGPSVLEDPEAVPGCQKKARTVFCIHD